MASEFLPPVVVRVMADIKEFSAKMGETKAEMDTLGSKGAATGKLMSTAFLGVGGAVGGLALGIAGVSVALGEKFQTAMTKTSGQLGLTEEKTKKLGDQFSKMALGSEYSSTELANAYAGVARQVQNLAGGQNLAKSSTDVLRASMELATATGQDLTSSTSSIVGLMRTFQMPTKDAAGAMATLYNTSTLTGNSVASLVPALSKMGKSFAGVSPDAADLSSLMVDFSQHGINGSRAMMGVTTAMQKMLDPAFQAKAAQAGLNLQVYDASGKFVGFRNVISQLAPQVQGLSQQQVQAKLTAAGFGSAAEALTPTLLAGVGAYDKASAAVHDHKRAQDAAEKASQTFHGRLKTLQSAATTLGTDLGNALLPHVTDLVNFLDTKGIKAMDDFRKGFDGQKVKGWAGEIGKATKAASDFLGSLASGKTAAKPGQAPSAGGTAGVLTRGALRMGGDLLSTIGNMGRGAWDIVNPFGASWWSSERWKRVGADWNAATASSGAFNRAFTQTGAAAGIKGIKLEPGPVGPVHGDVGITGAASSHLTAMRSTSDTHLPKISSATDYTSQHTRETNNHLMKIATNTAKKDTVNIKVRLA